MKSPKKIKITLEQILQSRTVQRHGPGNSYTTDIEDMPTLYEVIELENAVLVDWFPLGTDYSHLTIGTRLSEKHADMLARDGQFLVTVKR